MYKIRRECGIYIGACFTVLASVCGCSSMSLDLVEVASLQMGRQEIGCYKVALSRTAEFMVAVSSMSTVTVYDTEARSPLVSFDESPRVILGFELSDDDARLLIHSRDRSIAGQRPQQWPHDHVRVVDLASGDTLCSLSLPSTNDFSLLRTSGDISVTLSPDGRCIAVHTDSWAGAPEHAFSGTSIWDVDSGTRIASTGAIVAASGVLEFMPDGDRLLVGPHVVGIPSLHIFGELTVPEKRPSLSELHAVVFSRDGKRMYCASRAGMSFPPFPPSHERVFEGTLGREVKLRPITSPLNPWFHGNRENLCLDADGTLLATGEKRFLRLWDLSTGREAGRTDVYKDSDSVRYAEIRSVSLRESRQLVAVAALSWQPSDLAMLNSADLKLYRIKADGDF